MEIELIKKKAGRPLGRKTNFDNVTCKLGRPLIQSYDIFHPEKANLTKSLRSYDGQHLNRCIRYAVTYNGSDYLFSTLNQIMTEFNMTFSLVNRLSICFNNLKEGKKLTKYE